MPLDAYFLWRQHVTFNKYVKNIFCFHLISYWIYSEKIHTEWSVPLRGFESEISLILLKRRAKQSIP
jgi:general stress protein CsbA